MASRRTYATSAAAVLAYIAAIVAANWMTAHYGLIPVLPGLLVTAGTYSAGLALLLRDVIQDTTGRAVHMGRVNSETRLRHAMAIGCDTADGTFLAFGPDQNLKRIKGWFARLPKRQPPHVLFPLFDDKAV